MNYKRTKAACFFTYPAMASIFGMPPILFLTFRELYGLSFTQLGTLVLVNFVCQLSIDLIFSFFSKYFSIPLTIRVMPLLTSLGLLVYAITPMLFPARAFAGLIAGTVIFSVAAGLSEVLVSPLLASLPSDQPDKDMSALHSSWAYGLLGTILISTVYLKIFGTENWMYLSLFFALLPLAAFGMLCASPIPDLNLAHEAGSKTDGKWRFGLGLCVVCIFLGSAAENTMTNWISGYLEAALHLAKVVGDIVGMALYAVLLGFARTLNAKFGWNIFKVLLGSMTGAAVCYLVAALSPNALISTVACVIMGVFTSMLWPGTLILMEEKFPRSGVAAYALMAAGGDLGASVAPQGLGIIVDQVSASAWAQKVGEALSLTPEELGMKVGMLFGAVFPILGVALLLYMKRYFKKETLRRT